MNFKILLSLFAVFLFGCAQPGEVFVPTDVIPIGEEPISEEPAEPITGGVIEEPPISEEPPVVEEKVMEEPVRDPVAVGTEVEDGVPVVDVTEGETVELTLTATDPDGDPIVYRFEGPLDDNGKWETVIGDAGEYQTIVTASDGETTTSQLVLIRVASKNKPPVIELSQSIRVTEGEPIELEPIISDADGDDVSVSYSGFMDGPSYKTTFDDAGEYTVTLTATDGTTTTSHDVRIIIENANRAPIIASLSDVTATEGELVSVNVLAADPDKDEVTITFSPPFDGKGHWQTSIGDAGTFDITVTASDGDQQAVRTFTLVVGSKNRPPVITNVPSRLEFEETETIQLEPVVRDPDGDEVSVRYTGFMTSSTHTTTYEDGNDDPSEYSVVIVASDGENQVSKEVAIFVRNKNRPPVFVLE